MVFKPLVEWRHRPIAWILGFFLSPFSVLFGFVILLRSGAYHYRWMRSQWSKVPVVGVGSFSVGGSGKTPMAQWICDQFWYRGRKVAYVTGGYGKRSTDLCLVSDGHHLVATVEDSGDEAYMVAAEFLEQGASIVVVADKNRLRAIDYLQREFKPDVIVLDDALQYKRLRSHVVVAVQDFFELMYPCFPLPIGRLRDWPRTERKNRLTIVSKMPSVDAALTSRSCLEGHLFRCRYVPTHLVSLENNRTEPWSSLQGREIVLVAGLGHHESFIRTVEPFLLLYNARVIHYIEFQDHHWYSSGDVDHILKTAGERRLVLTTHKDAVKIKRPWLGSAAKRFYIVRSKMQFKAGDEERIMNIILHGTGDLKTTESEG